MTVRNCHPPEDVFTEVGGELADFDLLSVEARGDEVLRVLYDDSDLAVSLPQQGAVVDVSGAHDDVYVIYDHQLTVDVY